MTLKGPAEKQGEALAAVQASSITAGKSPWVEGAVEAYFHDGSDWPGAEFRDACTARAAAAAEGTGFVVDATAVWGSNAASRKLVFIAGREEFVGFADTDSHIPIAMQQLQYAEQFGVDVGDIEFRDPPEMQVPDMPDA